MINKPYHNIDDFLKDSSFRNWALNSKLTDVTYWKHWLINNSDKKEIVEQAKTIIIGIQFKENIVSQEKINLAWNDFKTKILKK